MCLRTLKNNSSNGHGNQHQTLNLKVLSFYSFFLPSINVVQCLSMDSSPLLRMTTASSLPTQERIQQKAELQASRSTTIKVFSKRRLKVGSYSPSFCTCLHFFPRFNVCHAFKMREISCVVLIAGVPTAPLEVEARMDDEGWIVSWREPASDGGSPITSYAVEVREIKTC